MKYTAHGHLVVSLSVTVEVPDEDLEGLSEDEIKALVTERAAECEAGSPFLCYQCAGGSDNTDDGSTFSLDLDGEWKVTEVVKS